MAKFISPFTWPGGKSKQWNLIKSFFPNKRGVFVEPFLGGGSVAYNAMNEKLFSHYYLSDIDSHLIWSHAFLGKMKQDMFWPNTSLSKLKDNLAELYSTSYANWFLANNNLTFNGQAWGTYTQKRLEQNWNLNKMVRINNFVDMRNTNLGFGKLTYNSQSFNYTLKELKGIDENVGYLEDVLFYLDPPYFANKGKPYRYKFKEEDWKGFLKNLEEIDEYSWKFILSIDDCKETREMFAKYWIYEVSWFYSSSNTKKHEVKIGKELIITNYRK